MSDLNDEKDYIEQPDDAAGGKVVLSDGSELRYTRNQDSTLYIDKLKTLARSLRNDPCLPTEVLFKEQSSDALALVRRYIVNISRIIDVVALHGDTAALPSYSFRLPHLIHLDMWLNVVVRLQFATSLKVILDTLNENLSPGVVNRWGVLEYDRTSGYSVNGKPLTYGDTVDVFTTSEQLHGKVVFSSHAVLNCREIDGDSAPVFHLNTEQMQNMSHDNLVTRATAKTPEGEHLLGNDAWSFIHGLLYRISDDDEEVIDLSTDILSKLDYDPRINLKDYTALAARLSEEELPYGLNIGLLTSLREYYCKDADTFVGFSYNINRLYSKQFDFRSTLSHDRYIRSLKSSSFLIMSIHDLMRLLDGNSKLLRVKLVLVTGETVDAVTTTRQLTMPMFGAFNRLNPKPLYFQRISFIEEPATKVDFMKRLSDLVSNKKVKQDLDNFKLVDEIIYSDNVVGYVGDTAKAYYFDEQSSLEKDDKFAMFHQLSKRFKRIDKGLE